MVKFTSILSAAVLAATSFLASGIHALPTTTAATQSPSNCTKPAEVQGNLTVLSELYNECPLQFRFDNGQCTDWADARYYQLTCYHTQWWGNAKTWPESAMNTPGWVVSDEPRVPSIIAIQPGYQGCDEYGHVAVVESINDDGSVYTSDWNYYINGYGGPYVTTYVNFWPGEGVSFIWHE
ncbi:hypothetical protein K493DRAFT_389982 [Basidiobolus meristosporus CBS 931.73]|uniref:Peptidase C51 domain-containing protein n=1 Tax=Basidiobolus meristosporus CBS 931.73 TaxID=1314790 RepID=A0A1Y1YSR3_9FUNG|nr:hypothetical protein K493DRAFT_347487 [Basidiobolus meristosporus CBS 931.73]ORY01073.1 hypothetical protein K493DRAFT_389982 [Basidiobolus meristosporus CBS 931.73]|eukprot:ORY01072.1 hypothetical protein K493DRAFT_347487 [Basidiobolus meristosporus CBS 931.73]